MIHSPIIFKDFLLHLAPCFPRASKQLSSFAGPHPRFKCILTGDLVHSPITIYYCLLSRGDEKKRATPTFKHGHWFRTFVPHLPRVIELSANYILLFFAPRISRPHLRTPSKLQGHAQPKRWDFFLGSGRSFRSVLLQC